MNKIKDKIDQIIFKGCANGTTYETIAFQLNEELDLQLGVDYVSKICKNIRKENGDYELFQKITENKNALELLLKCFLENENKTKTVVSIKKLGFKKITEVKLERFWIMFHERNNKRSKKEACSVRNKDILVLARAKVSFVDIGKAYGLHGGTVGDICKQMGYTRKRINHEFFAPIVEKYNTKIENGECFYDITKQMKSEGIYLSLLLDHGFKYGQKVCLEKRNQMIKELYENGKTHREIIDGGVCNITSSKGFYDAIRKFKYRKIPGIKRGVSGFFEDKKLMKRLIHLREKRGLTFREIAEILKKEEFKSITEKTIQISQVSYKYHKYNRVVRKKVK